MGNTVTDDVGRIQRELIIAGTNLQRLLRFAIAPGGRRCPVAVAGVFPLRLHRLICCFVEGTQYLRRTGRPESTADVPRTHDLQIAGANHPAHIVNARISRAIGAPGFARDGIAEANARVYVVGDHRIRHFDGLQFLVGLLWLDLVGIGSDGFTLHLHGDEVIGFQQGCLGNHDSGAQRVHIVRVQ
ncbi:hypothetical protein D3C78_896100 [compost metagenome]